MSPDRKIDDFIKDILARPKKAESAERQLLQTLQSHPNIDPTLYAVSALQHTLTDKNPALIKKAAILVDKVLGCTIIACREADQPVTLTPDTSAICERLEKADRKLPKNGFLQSVLPSSYTTLIHVVVPELKQQPNEKTAQLRLPLTPLEWIFRADHYLLQLYQAEDPSDQDQLVDLIKRSVKPSPFGYLRLFDKPFAGISLSNVEEMPYPLSQENHLKVTDFLIAVFSQQLHPAETGIFLHLFKQQAYFSSAAEGKITYRNRALLANLNNWQEGLMTRLLFRQDDASDFQIQKLLQLAPLSFTQFLPVTMAKWTCSAAEMNPDFSSQETLEDYRHSATYHPLLARATDQYLTQHPDVGLSASFIDELGRKFIIEQFLPLLEDRLKHLGFLEKCQDGIETVQAELNNPPFGRFLFWH